MICQVNRVNVRYTKFSKKSQKDIKNQKKNSNIFRRKKILKSYIQKPNLREWQSKIVKFKSPFKNSINLKQRIFLFNGFFSFKLIIH